MTSIIQMIEAYILGATHQKYGYSGNDRKWIFYKLDGSSSFVMSFDIGERRYYWHELNEDPEGVYIFNKSEVDRVATEYRMFKNGLIDDKFGFKKQVWNWIDKNSHRIYGVGGL